MKREIQRKISILVLFFLISPFELAAHSEELDDPRKGIDTEKIGSENERIKVWGLRQTPFRSRIDSEKSEQIEIISGDTLRRYGAHSLADAVQNINGVETQTFCANCGAKRLTINGLRGEHTTILIDGFPMHSTVSSFYGIDAIPVVGVEEIELRRGAGSSLVGPEAIGGTINLITIDPTDNRLQLMTEVGSHGSSQTTLLATASSDSSGIMIAGQQGRVEPWDIDGNNIAESPFRKTQSATIKLVNQLSDRLKFSYRFSEATLLIIGGNTQAWKPLTYTAIQAQPSDFIDNDVRQTYIGPLARITDVIELNRRENAVVFDYDLSDDASLQFKASHVRQNLNALYSHAFDYDNRDEIIFFDGNYRLLWGNYRHLLTVGLDRRQQSMHSFSDALYEQRSPPLTKDDLSFVSQAFYLMNEWKASDRLSIDLALRIDQLDLNWIELDQSLNKTIIAPRTHLKYLHTNHISSRFSYGLGYRPPLTLFESEHGSDHNGFQIAIDEVETAHSYVYSFSMNYPKWFATVSGHYTQLQAMAYANDKVPQGQALIFQNSDEEYRIVVADIFLGGKPLEGLDLQLSYERFFFEDSYTRKLPSAAIEQRIKLDALVDFNWGSLGVQVTHIASRRLSRYGYDSHYNQYDLDVTSETFGKVSELKNQKAPAFWLLNASLSVPFAENYKLLLRGNNLFDFTQTAHGDSPATWHWHVNHAHFDNFHTWGPLQGREFFVGIQGKW